MSKLLHSNIPIANDSLDVDIQVMSVQTESMQNKSHASVTAEIPTGYKFLGWVGATTAGASTNIAFDVLKNTTINVYAGQVLDMEWYIIVMYLVAKE